MSVLNALVNNDFTNNSGVENKHPFIVEKTALGYQVKDQITGESIGWFDNLLEAHKRCNKENGITPLSVLGFGRYR